MSEILLCNQSLNTGSIQNVMSSGITSFVGLSCANPDVLNAYTPYVMSQDTSAVDMGVLGQLSPRSVAEELTNLSLSFGGDNVVALSDVTAKLWDYNIGVMGASTSVYGNRIGGFAGAVKNYQSALMEYRQAIETNSTAKTMAKQKSFSAFKTMQRNFQLELQAVTSHVKARKGIPLTNATRATNIARSSRNVTKLDVTNQIQASNLVKFSSYTKLLGNGLAVIDFGSRIGEIHNNYESGGGWEREMFIESSSFAASAAIGIAAANAGSTALGFLVMATPVGWLGLIVGGVIIAGTAAAVSMGTNSIVNDNAGDVYDSIMNFINSI